MATIANLNVGLKLTSRAFVSGLKKSRDSLNSFGSTVVDIGKSVLKFGTILSGVGLGALSVMWKKVGQNADALGKFSDRVGIAVEEMQKLEFHAELTGTEVGVLRKGLQNMVRGIADAADGTGEAKDALNKLGLSATFLKKLSPEKQFMMIADALETVENKVDDVQIGYDLFGGRGLALIKTMEGGSAAIKAAGDELESFGGILSRMDISRIEQANDNITRLWRALGAIANVLTVEISPIVAIVSKKLSDMVKNAEIGKLLKDNFKTAMVTVVNLFAQGLELMQNLMIKFMDILSRVDSSWSGCG
jgi:hypothetical protein